DAALVRLLSAAGLAAQLLRGREHTRARHVRAALGHTANAIIVDAACPGAQRLLVLATRLRLFHIANTWIIFEDAALGSNPAATTASDDVDLRRDDEFDDLDNVTVYRYGAQNREDAVDPKEEAFLEVRPPMPPRARSGLLAPQSDRLSATAVQILDGKGMFVDSHVLWIQTTGQQVEALEVFRACLARPLQAYVVAVADLPDDPGGVPQWRWTMGGEEEALLRERRTDLQGATLRGSTIIKYPEEYTDIEDNNLRKNDLYPKMNWPVTQNLAYSLNFGMLIYKRDNYGWDDGHGVFDGMIGEMQRHEHDMLATAVFIRPDRLPHIDLVAETFDMRTAVLFRQPSKSSVSNVYVLPFSPGVWRATGAVSLLALLLLVVQTQWWRSHRSSEQSDDPADHIEVGDCVTFIVGALSQQGFYCTPIMVSARITIITTFIANLFLFTSFSGSIVAIIQSPSTAIRSVQDLMQSEMKVGVQELPFQHVWFQEAVAEHDVASDVFNSKINTEDSPGFLTTKEGIKKVRFERFAFQVETNEGYREILDTFTEPEKCDLSELELFPAAPMVFCTSEKSPYREALSRA
ncbi:ionotropic receptor 75a-like, partial [Frankliniella occidentalis]|uniref:Ionotropic receptor 75a-like n=1 Tax=Frankliniella occidentalis TaxID=133901 RepID=A0A9C6XAI5_FRAOC